MIELTLPWPPQTNNLFRNVPGKGRVLTKEGKAYRKKTQYCGLLLEDRSILPINFPVRVELMLWEPDDRIRDGDNLLKSLLDALVSARVLADDNKKIVRRGEWEFAGFDKKHGGRVDVRIWPWD